MANLHVFTGDAAANTIRAALRIPDGQFLVQHDVISCGPLHSYTTRADWIAERTGFWLGLSRGESFGEFPNDLVAEAERLDDADRITVWVGAGLSDRLLLPTLIHLADIEGISLPSIELAEVISHRSLSVPVLGWGMLRPADVGQPSMRPVTDADRAAARTTWAAVTAPDPMAVPRHLESSSDVAEVSALATLIERYPDSERGLSHWDASLLKAMPTADSTAFEVVGGAIGANHQHLDPVGDLYLFWRLRRMAEMKHPLVVLEGDSRILPDTIRSCRIRPTELGRAVRDGKADATASNGIDDWIGGVHLRADSGSPWYRRNGELIPQSAT